MGNTYSYISIHPNQPVNDTNPVGSAAQTASIKKELGPMVTSLLEYFLVFSEAVLPASNDPYGAIVYIQTNHMGDLDNSSISVERIYEWAIQEHGIPAETCRTLHELYLLMAADGHFSMAVLDEQDEAFLNLIDDLHNYTTDDYIFMCDLLYTFGRLDPKSNVAGCSEVSGTIPTPYVKQSPTVNTDGGMSVVCDLFRYHNTVQNQHDAANAIAVALNDDNTDEAADLIFDELDKWLDGIQCGNQLTLVRERLEVLLRDTTPGPTPLEEAVDD